jgi:hypothetical protein
VTAIIVAGAAQSAASSAFDSLWDGVWWAIETSDELHQQTAPLCLDGEPHRASGAKPSALREAAS